MKLRAKVQWARRGGLVVAGINADQQRFEVRFRNDDGTKGERTRLEFVVYDGPTGAPEWVNRQHIHVEAALRRCGVGAAMVEEVARLFPGVRLMFTAMNPWSRRFARTIAASGRIPAFDVDARSQEAHRLDDEAAGFYDSKPPSPPTLTETLRGLQ